MNEPRTRLNKVVPVTSYHWSGATTRQISTLGGLTSKFRKCMPKEVEEKDGRQGGGGGEKNY